jgi:putative hemolysin
MESITKHPLDIPINNKILKRLVESITRIDGLRKIYDDWLIAGNHEAENSGAALLEFGLEHMNTTVEWENPDQLCSVPEEGPLIIISNHPLGGLEGMLLTQSLLKIRPDLKVLTNDLLLRFPEFESVFVGVDILNPEKSAANSQGIRTVAKHLDKQGALLIFPAGTVSGINFKNWKIEDKKWNDIVGRLVKKYHCSVVPFYVKSRNNLGFYFSEFIHKRCRTALLGRAMLSKSNSTVRIKIGEVINFKEVECLETGEKICDYLRLCTDVLAEKENLEKIKLPNLEKIKQDIKLQQLNKKINELKQYKVLNKAQYSVYCAPYSELGCIMEQIAIDREKAFRAVSEGTGKDLDSDKFDPYYWHLWVWDEVENKLVGGYRLGKVDEIICNHGIQSLYSNSLYHYQKGFISGLSHSIEVGRSFVSLEYQRNTRVLDLLWKGIGAFMVANKEYHTLFGCVSVSKEYSNLAQAFLADSLLKHFNAKPNILSNVKARTPIKIRQKPWSKDSLLALSNIPIINKLLGRIDNGKTIPMLIRHYLSLNGRFASFSVNKNFNHSLDGLIIVDMRNTPDKYLIRYLGKEGTKEFNKKWGTYERVA